MPAAPHLPPNRKQAVYRTTGATRLEGKATSLTGGAFCGEVVEIDSICHDGFSLVGRFSILPDQAGEAIYAKCTADRCPFHKGMVRPSH